MTTDLSRSVVGWDRTALANPGQPRQLPLTTRPVGRVVHASHCRPVDVIGASNHVDDREVHAVSPVVSPPMSASRLLKITCVVHGHAPRRPLRVADGVIGESCRQKTAGSAHQCCEPGDRQLAYA
jgi:hypothetical protein